MDDDVKPTETLVHVRSSAPAKVILFGEHSVVYGAPAIAATINKRTVVNLEINDTDEFRLQFGSLDLDSIYTLPLAPDVLSAFPLTHPQKLAAQCVVFIYESVAESLSNRGININVTSNFPISAGLGSSASFAVAVAAAFLTAEAVVKGEDVPTNAENRTEISDIMRRRICKLAHEGEKLFHGNPSGVDTEVCSMGGIVRFQKEKGVERIADKLAMKMIIVDSRVSRSTSKLVEQVRELKQELGEPIEAIFQAMALVADKAAEEIREPTSEKKLKDLVRMNQGLLEALGVSHYIFDKMKVALKWQNVALKLTGAGAGGNAIVFVPSDTNERAVVNALRRDFTSTVVDVGVPGVEVDVLKNECKKDNPITNESNSNEGTVAETKATE